MPQPAIHSHVFDIEHFQLQSFHSQQGLLHHVQMNFARGRQGRVSRTENSFVKASEQVPATWIDGCKQALTRGQPSLSFGWLKPQMREVKTIVQQDIEETYFNIYPLHREDERSRIGFTEMIKPLDFLLAEPPTIAEVEQSREELLQQRATMDAVDLARYFR